MNNKKGKKAKNKNKDIPNQKNKNKKHKNNKNKKNKRKSKNKDVNIKESNNNGSQISINDEKTNVSESINLNLFLIKNDNLWQDIVKEIYNIEPNININRLLLKADTLKPINSFAAFCRHEYNELDVENIEGRANVKYNKIKNICFNKWSTMSKEQKKPYIKESEDMLIKYEKTVAILKKYLFLGINSKKNDITEFDFYLLDEIINDQNNLKRSQILQKAIDEWENNLEDKIKDKYTNIKNKIFECVDKLDNINYLNSQDLYIKEKCEENINENISINERIVKYKNAWKRLAYDKKITYIKKAMIENLKNEVLLNIKDVINNQIIYKHSFQPINLFKYELRELYMIKRGFNVSELWNNLDENIKELYIMKCHRLNLVRKYNNSIVLNKRKYQKKKKKKDKNIINNSLITNISQFLEGEEILSQQENIEDDNSINNNSNNSNNSSNNNSKNNNNINTNINNNINLESIINSLDEIENINIGKNKIDANRNPVYNDIEKFISDEFIKEQNNKNNSINFDSKGNKNNIKLN